MSLEVLELNTSSRKHTGKITRSTDKDPTNPITVEKYFVSNVERRNCVCALNNERMIRSTLAHQLLEQLFGCSPFLSSVTVESDYFLSPANFHLPKD